MKHLFLELVKICTHITMEIDFTYLIHDTSILFSDAGIDVTDFVIRFSKQPLNCRRSFLIERRKND